MVLNFLEEMISIIASFSSHSFSALPALFRVWWESCQTLKQRDLWQTRLGEVALVWGKKKSIEGAAYGLIWKDVDQKDLKSSVEPNIFF